MIFPYFHTVDKAEKLLYNVEMAAKLIGLHINEKKTQYMTLTKIL